MGKLALMLVLALAGVAVVHGSATGDGLRESTRQASEGQRLALSRAAAKTGWARAKQGLVANFVSDTLSGSNGEATYETRVVVAGDEAIVTSIGRMPIPGRFTTTDFQITYRLEAIGGDAVPEFAEHAVAVQGDLSMSGNGAIVEPGVAGGAGDSLSIRIHANGNLHAGSGSTVVEGFGSYTTSSSGKLSKTFQPRTNPDGDPELAQADSVAIPPIVPSEIVSAYGGATAVYPANAADFWDARLVGVLPGGTRDAPAVYHVRGNALLTNLTITGYAVFIAEGRVDIGGTVKGTPEPGLDESALAVFTTGEVTMNGGANAYASLFADGGMSYKGNVDIYGSLVVGSDFSHGGGATVHYVPATASLFRPWGWVDPTLRLVAYREQ